MARVNIVHRIRLLQQPSACDCWATACAMARGRGTTVQQVKELAQRAGVRLDRDGSLSSRDAQNARRLATAVGLRCHGVSTTAITLELMTRHLRPGVMVILGGFNYPGRNALNHAIAVQKLIGDGTDGGTNITVVDPFSGRAVRDTWQSFAVYDDAVMADPHYFLTH